MQFGARNFPNGSTFPCTTQVPNSSRFTSYRDYTYEREKSANALTTKHFHTSTILSPIWMDRDNVFWHPNKRPYIQPQNRALAETAVAAVFEHRPQTSFENIPPSLYYSPGNSRHSSSTHSSSTSCSLPPPSVSHGYPHPAEIEAYRQAESKELLFRRLIKRQERMRDGHYDDSSSDDEEDAYFIHNPVPRRLMDIPFLSAQSLGDLESTKCATSSKESEDICITSPLQTSFVHEFQEMHLHNEEVKLEEDDRMGLWDNGFDADDECDDFDEDWCTQYDTPSLHASSLSSTMDVDELQNRSEESDRASRTSSDSVSVVTTIEYPAEHCDDTAMLSPVDFQQAEEGKVEL